MCMCVCVSVCLCVCADSICFVLTESMILCFFVFFCFVFSPSCHVLIPLRESFQPLLYNIGHCSIKGCVCEFFGCIQRQFRDSRIRHKHVKIPLASMCFSALAIDQKFLKFSHAEICCCFLEGKKLSKPTMFSICYSTALSI